MGTVILSFAEFMPAVFFLGMIGILVEFVYDAFRGRF